MVTVSQLNLGALADSPYVAGAQRGYSNRHFGPRLEPEYVLAHLRGSRLLIRVACALATLLAIARGVEQVAVGSPNTGSLIAIGLVVAASLMLTTIAWSPAFERLYLPCARIVVPARNALVAAYVAAAASHGQLEMLMVLPIVLIGPFFFLGLSFRMALFSGVVTSASFVTHTLLFDLALPVALKSWTFLLMALVACAIAARHLEKWSRTSFLEARLLAELAQHDALTGTKNRRVFDDHLARLWPQAEAEGRTMAVLLIDVDHFKAYNDCYGHQAGDRALHQIAQSIQAVVRRPLDVLARYGGEEFAAVLYDVDGKEAMDIADRMRRSVHGLGIEHRGSRTSSAVTISIGIAVIEPTADRNSRGALQLADQALYAAKMSGRDRIELMNEADYKMLVTGVFARNSRAPEEALTASATTATRSV